MRKRIVLIIPFLLCGVIAWGGPPSKQTVTFPDAGVYTYWVQAKPGSVSVPPTTVTGKHSVALAKPVLPGDTLYALDAHSGQIAALPLAPEKPLTLTVGDFKPLTPTLPPGAASVPVSTPAAKTPETAAAGFGAGIGRVLTFVFGILVLVGVVWIIRKMIQTKGAPLVALARKAGVEVNDPVPLNGEADAPPPVYTPPAPRPLEKIPDEALAPPPTYARAKLGPGLALHEFPQLIGLQGLAAGSSFSLTAAQTVIGRDGDNGIVLAENTVSRRHARATRDGSRIVLEDLGSANGIYVNGTRIERAVLESGDKVKIGDNYFRFEA